MSLYTFAAANLTTPADLRRRPAIGIWQLARTLILFAFFAVAFGLSVHGSHATGDVAHEVVAELQP